MSISEQLCNSTVRIEGQLKNGLITGTGFFFHFLETNGSYLPCIVSNRHIFEKALTISFYLPLQTTEGVKNNERVNISDFQKAWIKHPNPDIDLGIIPLAFILNHLELQGKNVDYVALNKGIIPTKQQISEFSAIEDIIMIGYPNGLWDEVNNKPIVRKGITATHPKYDLNGKKEFFIDAACFPGSSGSPVFILNEGTFLGENGGINIGKRLYLLGILKSGPQNPTQGVIVNTNYPIITNIPNNLGCVIKAEELCRFEDDLKERIVHK